LNKKISWELHLPGGDVMTFNTMSEAIDYAETFDIEGCSIVSSGLLTHEEVSSALADLRIVNDCNETRH
jgi:hypothetical protein